jgi:hypothetical protein
MANLGIVTRVNVIGRFSIEGHLKTSLSRQSPDREHLQDEHRCDIRLYDRAAWYNRKRLHLLSGVAGWFLAARQMLGWYTIR